MVTYETETIRQKLHDILLDKMGATEGDLKDTALLIEDIGADSLDAMEICMDLETAYGIEIPVPDFEKLRSIGEIVEYLDKRLNAGD